MGFLYLTVLYNQQEEVAFPENMAPGDSPTSLWRQRRMRPALPLSSKVQGFDQRSTLS